MLEAIYQSPFEEFVERQRRTCKILGRIDPESYDFVDVGPMWVIAFEDGVQIDAFPEELGIGEFYVGGAPWPSRIDPEIALALPIYTKISV